ncbi:UbiX family flavin prenyltransferase [Paratractidigestivibacter sp.]|uniref:UbiX family flavin prenyltransferase n=1 Tax=Paratractidigestivibacter sp. TaxID=2847316 RepID=UPI002ABD7EBC|nr:UbiX family flavin prenyltransferase [Paratractidigestivibacter sp.]
MKRIIVGMTGASGAQLGIAVLRALAAAGGVETHLVMSDGAKAVLARECAESLEEVEALADAVHDNRDLAAPISSGSFITDGMIVAPCSMKSLSAIANAYDDDLVVRAADVSMKEGRRVVLVPREMPLNRAHCRNLSRCAEDGYAIVAPMLTFYNGCETTEQQVDHVVGKVLMQFGIEYERFRPWAG